MQELNDFLQRIQDFCILAGEGVGLIFGFCLVASAYYFAIKPWYADWRRRRRYRELLD